MAELDAPAAARVTALAPPATGAEDLEVGRLRLPVAITPLTAIGKQIQRLYGPDITMRQEGPWLVFYQPNHENRGARGSEGSHHG